MKPIEINAQTLLVEKKVKIPGYETFEHMLYYDSIPAEYRMWFIDPVHKGTLVVTKPILPLKLLRYKGTPYTVTPDRKYMAVTTNSPLLYNYHVFDTLHMSDYLASRFAERSFLAGSRAQFFLDIGQATMTPLKILERNSD